MVTAKKSKPVWVKWLIILIILAVIGGAIGYYVYQSKQPTIDYATETVKRETIEDTVLAGGVVNAKELVEVGSQATGQVQRLYVELGQRVKKGQPIADIDATQQRNQLQDDQLTYQGLLNQQRLRQANLSQAQAEFASQKLLYDNQVLSQMDFLKAKNALDTAKAELQANRIQLEQARLKIQTAETNLHYTHIVAPIDGVVVSVVTKQGQTINAAQSSPTIVKLAQIDTVQVKAKFSEADVPKLKAGMPASFSILGIPNKHYQGKLDALELSPISSDIGGQTGAVYYYGMLSVPNPNHELFIGMTANVTVKVAERQNVLTIPITALGEPLGNNRYKVQVLNRSTSNEADAQPETRQITLGLNNKLKAEVVTGLNAGDNVVVSQSDGKVAELDTGL